jgi:hypothetical protein
MTHEVRCWSRAIPLWVVMLCWASAHGAEPPLMKAKAPVDFKVFKMGLPATGLWSFIDPASGAKRSVEIRQAPGARGGLLGVLPESGEEILSLDPKTEGIGFSGSLEGLLARCGQDRVPVSDFLPLGDEIMVKLEAKAPVVACPFLENPESARYFVAASPNQIRLRAIGEITSERTREQIGLAGQPGGTPTPKVADALYAESGAEMLYRGRVRSLDGSIWIEVEGRVSPAPGIEPPRGYLPPESLRVAAALTLTRVQSAEPPQPPH